MKKYTYKYLHDEELDGNATFVVENIPAYAFSGYSKIKGVGRSGNLSSPQAAFITIWRENPERTSFYDYRKFSERYWRPMKAVMTYANRCRIHHRVVRLQIPHRA